jgi:hypothetical protein
MRKELDLDVEQHIKTMVKISNEKQNLIRDWTKYIKDETRSDEYIYSEKPVGKIVKYWDIDDLSVVISIEP